MQTCMLHRNNGKETKDDQHVLKASLLTMNGKVNK